MLALLTNYLVCELPGVLARRPGAVSVGLIDQDLHPAARVRALGKTESEIEGHWRTIMMMMCSCSKFRTLDSCFDFLAIM